MIEKKTITKLGHYTKATSPTNNISDVHWAAFLNSTICCMHDSKACNTMPTYSIDT